MENRRMLKTIKMQSNSLIRREDAGNLEEFIILDKPQTLLFFVYLCVHETTLSL